MRTEVGGLEQLIYISVAKGRAESAMQMSDILDQARPNNARDGVTGALTAVNGRFLQIIEGPAARLDDLLARLAEDERHRDLEILERRQVLGRTFADWDMVSPRLMPAEVNKLAVLLDEDRRDLDAYAPVFLDALARQSAVLDDSRSPSSSLPEGGASRSDGAGGASK
ncbi:MAG: BLUF domain-containing protein [Brevundimonas sp.]|nr:MAG: BLUF domain-containing protein [Brevundimonas sp.]